MAPVFLLTGIGSLLITLTNRLARIVDRARWIEENLAPRGEARRADQVREMRLLDRRMRIVNNSIMLVTASAVCICTVVAAMFLLRLAGFGFARTLSIVFALSLCLLIAGLALFIHEVRIAVRAIAIRDELLERD
ncbi:DUF2721 domain-containing protein [Sphingomonas nostoxanthinifaciens]|nr:DUF2721 domain-containing protein [Sphingomonas nostoxanthinifaciens]